MPTTISDPLERYAVRGLDAAAATAAEVVSRSAFSDLGTRLAAPPWPGPDPEEAARRTVARVLHVIETDPGGSWGAYDGDELVGVALAIRRDSVWGLSLLVIDPAHQSTGIGRRLLNRALDYAHGCTGGIILSSSDHRALRAYATSGFELRPGVHATGVPDRTSIPGGLHVDEDGDPDLDLVDTVDAVVRGASHRVDIPALMDAGGRFIKVADAEGKGYAVIEHGTKVLAATSDAVARRLLWTSLALTGTGTSALVANIDGAQQWAVDVVLQARLEFMPYVSGLLVRGRLGPLRPYIPSGAYL